MTILSKQYCGKNTLTSKNVNAIKSLFKDATLGLTLCFNGTHWEDFTDREKISHYAYGMYTRNAFIINALHDANHYFAADSEGEKDRLNALHAFSIFDNHMMESEHYLSSFFIITPKPSHWHSLNLCSVTLHYSDILFFQRRQARGILQELNNINLDNLKLPLLYKELTSIAFDNFRNSMKTILSAKRNTMLFPQQSPQQRSTDLSEASSFDMPLSLLENNKLAKSQEDFLLNLLTHRFIWKEIQDLEMQGKLTCPASVDGEDYGLTPEEIEENLAIINALREETITQLNIQIKSRAKAPIQKKTSAKAKKKTQHPRSQKTQNTQIVNFKPDLQTLQSDTPVTQTTSLLSVDVLPKELESEEVVKEDNNTPNQFDGVKRWLENIMERTNNKKGKFSAIYFKAHSQYSSLIKYPELVDQIQQGAQSLALLLQKLEAESMTNAKNKMVVPDPLDWSFRYFIDTPICYLKSLRMGYVTNLFEALGINVDKTREGSRVHFDFKDYKTSIHIHDKYNGILDSGAIVSLRQYLINIGWTVKD